MSAGTILIVEDNPDDESLILRSLRRANVTNRIEIVHDGEEALEYLFSTGRHAGRGHALPTVTLLDIKLPKVDGLEVLQQVRSDPRTVHLPIVILTSSDEQEDIVRSYRLHVNSYVRKPVQFDRFSEVVGQLGLYWLLVNEFPPDLKGPAT